MKRKSFGHASVGIAFASISSLPLACQCFAVLSSNFPRMSKGSFKSKVTISSPRRLSTLKMNINSDDPFKILGLDEPTADLKVVKRAYKRMALRYHPDVITTKDSSAEEKKQASDRFAKINWAYQTLSGKGRNDKTYKATSSASSGSSSTGWTPPHKRGSTASTSSYSSSTSSSTGTNWEDFMPKYDDDQYDTGGDSFGKIFSDLFVGAAAGAVGLGGGPNVFKDFIDFLEGNIDGYGISDDDSELRVLLNTAPVEEIGNEMGDTELVVQQLKTKLKSIDDEIIMLSAERKVATRYLERMEIEENLAELNSRKEVVKGYLKKAQKRLLALQTKYKELITRGETDSSVRGSRRSSWDDMSSSNSRGSSSSTSSSHTESRANESSRNDEDAWMNEGFGSSSSYERGSRRGGRRRSRRTNSTESPRASSSTTEGPSRKDNRASARQTAKPPASANTSSQRTNSATGAGYRKTTSPKVDTPRPTGGNYVPPHRRAASFRTKEEDKRRLRELKVDEEFDKLKKELGL